MFIRSRRAPRRGPIVRALRWLLRQPPERQRMPRRDYQLLAEERGEAVIMLRRERDDLARELRTKDRALKMADARALEAERRAHELANQVQVLQLRLEQLQRGAA